MRAGAGGCVHQVSVYQLHPALSSHVPKRHFGPASLRNAVYLEVGRGINLAKPPHVSVAEKDVRVSKLHSLNLHGDPNHNLPSPR
jgi:hypothetical protein